MAVKVQQFDGGDDGNFATQIDGFLRENPGFLIVHLAQVVVEDASVSPRIYSPVTLGIFASPDDALVTSGITFASTHPVAIPSSQNPGPHKGTHLEGNSDSFDAGDDIIDAAVKYLVDKVSPTPGSEVIREIDVLGLGNFLKVDAGTGKIVGADIAIPRVVSSGTTSVANNSTVTAATLSRLTSERLQISIWVQEDTDGQDFYWAQNLSGGDVGAYFQRTGNANEFRLILRNAHPTNTYNIDWIVVALAP